MKSVHEFASSIAMVLALSSIALAQSHEVYRQEGSAADQTGQGVAGIGDVDGDGVGDFAVGSPFAGPIGNRRGNVYVWSGKTGGLIRIHLGDADGDRFGWAIDGIGDVNHDGVGDYVIGAPYADHALPLFTLMDCGKAYVYSGQSGAQISFNYFQQGGALAGYSVCGVGDINGDSTPDWAMGAPYADSGGLINNGAVTAVPGNGAAWIWISFGTSSLDLFGYSIDSTGKIDGDNRDDLVVGAPNADVITTNNGAGYVLSGVDGSLIFSRFGAWTNGYMGWSVAGVGDVNGDGTPDVAFGEPYADANGIDSGRVLVSSGAAPYLQLNNFTGGSDIRLGMKVTAIGDADGDGRPDYACSAPYADLFGSVDAGWIYLVSGASGTSFVTLTGESALDYFGMTLAGTGDLNGDGFADLIAGGPWSDLNGADCGLARVFLNKVPPPDTYCTLKVNSADCTPTIDHQGTPSLSIANDFEIGAQQVLYNTPGVLIWSSAPAATPFGGGLLCVAPPVKRTPGQLSGGVPGQPCSGTFNFHFSHAYMASQGLTAGAIVHAQYWSRDNGFPAPNNIGLTNAVKFTIIP